MLKRESSVEGAKSVIAGGKSKQPVEKSNSPAMPGPLRFIKGLSKLYRQITVTNLQKARLIFRN
ncbi:MAG TPA: hypothetical protein VKX17_20605 [Planctomycetota bacterium]|nr:hypothetical protein [Planctomycetota bacterium]